jgi:hypothetical protein
LAAPVGGGIQKKIRESRKTPLTFYGQLENVTGSNPEQIGHVIPPRRMGIRATPASPCFFSIDEPGEDSIDLSRFSVS